MSRREQFTTVTLRFSRSAMAEFDTSVKKFRVRRANHLNEIRLLDLSGNAILISKARAA